MVQFTPYIGVALLLSGLVSARPTPEDSAVGEEVAVSAPDGVILSDTSELARQSSSAAAATSTSSAVDAMITGSSSYGSSSSGSSSSSYNTPSYGSGSSNWGSWDSSGYNDCVNQCIAQYGSPAYAYKPTATSGGYGSTGTGATHTVVVAPSQGVLRYIPFALNASVGDTVKFMWGANNHTVTKSSALTPCNKSSDALFASGTQNKDFVFTQVVNDTNPVFFYCATPGHCQKGMFGVINPPSGLNNPTSVSAMMPAMVANSSDLAAMAAYSDSQCKGTKAAKWGGNIDLANVPDWAKPHFAENVMYTRNFLAANPDVMKDDGSVDLSAAGTNPMMIPQDITSALSNSAAAPPSASSGTPATGASSSVAPSGSAGSAGANATPNGAASLASPRVLVGVMVAIATFFAL